MPFAFNSRTSLALATVIIFLAGLAAGLWRYDRARETYLGALIVKASRCAIAFEDDELRQLSGTRADLASPVYASVKSRLIRLQRIDPSVRFVYLFRHVPDTGKVIFLADSEAPDSPDVSLPGDEYPEAPASPGLQSVLATGLPGTEGPLADQFGAWVTGYAPIGQPAAGAPRDLLGLDLAAEQWHRTLWTAALGTAGYVWLFLVLPLVALVSTTRQAQQRDALRNLTEAMDQGHSAMAIIDLDERIEYANTGFGHQLGYSRRELIGRPWRELQGSKHEPEITAEISTAMRAGQGWAGEWMMQRKDGSLLPVRGGITPVKDRHHALRSFVAVFEDMTAVRRTEQVLRESKERAEAGDRAKGQFLATMSHEVRTPLNGIVGFASLLLDTELTPEQQEYAETIRTSSETLIQLTGDILDYARIESGRLKLEAQPCDPRECIESALDLVAATSIQKNIELLHWVEDGVPGAIIADVSRLRQVMVNLVNNAVKFTADGEVEVRARLLRLEPPVVMSPTPSTPPMPVTYSVLEFSVRDTGIGIAAEHHDKIFRPFSQVDDSTTRRFGGTGLGLAICKNIVELMNGSIAFASEPGRGSTFTFTIRVPVHTATPAEGAPAVVAQPLLGRRLAIAVAHPGLRHELLQLGQRWGAEPFEVERSALPRTSGWDLAIVDITGSHAMELAGVRVPRLGLPAEKMIALVPIVLPGELRGSLRTHFRLVLNKPLHHDMLASLLVAPATPVPLAPSAPAEPARSPEATPGDFHALRVLIVEDNAVNQRLIQKVIARLGCQWSVAANGRIALEQLAQAQPDVVLMDLHMPELDGLSATAKIRAGEAGVGAKDTWIIALTADAREEQRERTLAAGANDYLTKPVQLAELTAALRRYLAQRRC